MKKLLYVLTVLLIFSCSSSDEGSGSSGYDFNPPVWIQGTWMQVDASGNVGGVSFTFSPHDLYLDGFGSMQVVFDDWRKRGFPANTKEIISSSLYSVEMNLESKGLWSFKKISNTEIEFTQFGTQTVLVKI